MPPQLSWAPPFVVGVGCSSGAPAAEILELIDLVLAEGGLGYEDVWTLATLSAKANELGVVAAARTRALPVRLFGSAALAAVEVENPSEVVRSAVGTPSVAEAAALGAAAIPWAPWTEPSLVVPKRTSPMATAAVARRPSAEALARRAA